MEAWAVVLIVFVIVGGVLFFLLIASSNQGKGEMALGEHIRFNFDFLRQSPPSPVPTKNPPPARPQHQTKCWLEVKRPGKKPWRYYLDHSQHVYIGRRQDNQIVLTDQTADTQQAVIYWEAGRFKINNLSAKTPTRVNGKVITRNNLGNGNTIQMGNTKFIFRQK